MVRRCGAAGGGDLDARPRAELVGVDPAPEGTSCPGLQHLGRLVGVKGAHLAEHVDPSSVRSAGVEHGRAHERHIVVGPAGELGRHRVGAEEGRLLCVPVGDAEAPLFVGGGEPIARFALEGRRPRAQGFGRQPRDGGIQDVVTGGPRRRHRVEDPAGFIFAARQPGGELRAAVAGKDQVSVAVHEAGQDGPAADVDEAVTGTLRHLARVPHPGHPAVDGHEGSLARHPSGPSPMAASLLTSKPMLSKTVEPLTAGGLTATEGR